MTDKELEPGTCCFCDGECNPLSQSCGLCARGLSGAALGLPVPRHLRKFIYEEKKGSPKDSPKDRPKDSPKK